MAPMWYDGDSFTIYLYNHEEHRRPHLAVRIGTRNVASVDIASGDILAGSLPPKVHRCIRDLLDDHRDAALIAFVAALNGEPFDRLSAGGRGEGDHDEH